MITFEREARTPHSEIFTIWEEGSIIGRIDLHYGGQGGQVHATICTVGDATEEQIQALIDSADERLVMTADEGKASAIFLMRVAICLWARRMTSPAASILAMFPSVTVSFGNGSIT